MIKILKAHRQLGFYMVLLTFVWKCFQDRNFQGVVVGLYEQSIRVLGRATRRLAKILFSSIGLFNLYGPYEDSLGSIVRLL